MKTIIITGSNSGIGKEAAHNLAKSGHRILMLCRDSEKSKQVQREIISQSGNENVFLIPVDLADPVSIRSAVAKIKSENPVIDVLVNNAGIYKVKRQETPGGVEMTLADEFPGALYSIPDAIGKPGSQQEWTHNQRGLRVI